MSEYHYDNTEHQLQYEKIKLQWAVLKDQLDSIPKNTMTEQDYIKYKKKINKLKKELFDLMCEVEVEDFLCNGAGSDIDK